MVKKTLISGAKDFFSTSQSKKEKNNTSNGPKGKTPGEDEGKQWMFQLMDMWLFSTCKIFVFFFN